MANAYASLRSLINTIRMEQTPRPHHPILFPEPLIESLLVRVQSLLNFFEGEFCKAADQHLLDRIVELANAAEDAIEIPIVDLIQSQCSDPQQVVISGLIQSLQQQRSTTSSCCTAVSCRPDLDVEMERIIRDLDSIKAEVMLLTADKISSGIKLPDLPQISSDAAAPQGQKIKMVGLEEEKEKIMEKLAGNKPSRQVIPIVGMGGVGKTTLAKTIYNDKFIGYHFHVQAWVAVSQEYNVRSILIEVLSCLKVYWNDKEDEETLGEKVYKRLIGRRYLLVLDDIWSIDVWNTLQRFFPLGNDGSRVMITTRISSLATDLSNWIFEMKCLDADNSWILLQEKVFGTTSCPLELEQVGKNIARNCRGLPLAIVVIGGLLAKFNTLEYWKQVEQDFSSSMYLTDDEQCAKTLLLSYNHLPIHLKPCFLYLGVFPEDHVIPAAQLTNLWIGEGFLKPTEGKIWKEIAEVYLKELVERNLIMVSERKWNGGIKKCAIHDLLRELCLKEAQKEKFLCVVNAARLENQPSMNCQRRIVTSPRNWKVHPIIIDSLQSVSSARSLIIHYGVDELVSVLGSPFSKLLRVVAFFRPRSMSQHEKESLSEVMPNPINARHLAFPFETDMAHSILGSNMRFFRNLQMVDLRVEMTPVFVPILEIWDLPQLRHVKFNRVIIPEPPSCQQDQQDHIVLENLQSLTGLEDFRFGEAVLKRIPNVTTLKVTYSEEGSKEWSLYSLDNLARLQKLESCSFSSPHSAMNSNEFLQTIASLQSLKKLCLFGCQLGWEDMTVIGHLPRLEVLKLSYDSFVGQEWDTIEGEFCHLKFLYMKGIRGLINWNTDSSHFPRLERLYMYNCEFEIPLEIGEISTLAFIELDLCSVSAMMSAKDIAEEQHGLGNEYLLVKVRSGRKIKSIHGSDPEIKNFIAKSYLNEYKDEDEDEDDSNEIEDEDYSNENEDDEL